MAFYLESADPIDATIILDHFDHVIQMANWENFLKSYAHNAFESRRFNLMLCVTSEAHVLQIIGLNGGRMFKYLGLDIPDYCRTSAGGSSQRSLSWSISSQIAEVPMFPSRYVIKSLLLY